MRKQYQTSWHGIEFGEFCEMDSKKVAGDDFYNSFYRQFFNRYSKFEDIPSEYIQSKLPAVRFLEEKLQGKRNVISIGCGIGLIEKLLLERKKSNSEISIVEPSTMALEWIKHNPKLNIYNGYFPEALEQATNFDFGYSRAVEYIFDQQEYISFLRSIVNAGIVEFSVISVCIDRRDLASLTKEFAKSILSSVGFYNRGQLWGFLRTEKDHLDAFYAAGYSIIEISKLDHSTIAITGLE